MKLFVIFRFSQKTAFFSTEVQDIITPSLPRVTTGQGHLENSQIEQFKSKIMAYMAKIAKLTISQLEPTLKGSILKMTISSQISTLGPNFMYQNDHQEVYY